MFCKKSLIFILLLLLTASCGPRSLDDFKEEGEGIIRSLIQDLKLIQTREDLIAASGRLQRHFDRLASLMIAAQEYCRTHPELDIQAWRGENHDLSDRLRVELNRLYRINGGREIIEKYQEKALHRLARELQNS